MKPSPIFLAACAALSSFAFLSQPASAADDAALLKEKGTLLFEDSFDRDEPTPDKEEIGNGWTTNSAWRAQGKKQADLLDGTLSVIRVPEANHGVAIFHDVAFQDGAVQIRFKLNEGEDFGIDFVDREEKSVHAGHLCMAKISLKGVNLQDSKTGAMKLEIQEQRKAGKLSPEVAKMLKTKSQNFPLDLKAGEWHEAIIVVEGDTMRATIDGELVGEFQSEGIAHPTKRMITLAVNKAATVDGVKVWKLK